jgi:hypothetical protein
VLTFITSLKLGLAESYPSGRRPHKQTRQTVVESFAIDPIRMPSAPIQRVRRCPTFARVRVRIWAPRVPTRFCRGPRRTLLAGVIAVGQGGSSFLKTVLEFRLAPRTLAPIFFHRQPKRSHRNSESQKNIENCATFLLTDCTRTHKIWG